ncbi:MAG: histidinol dehydrogenase [Pseudomonadota bacterium]
MAMRLSTRDPDFQAGFKELLGQKRETAVDIVQAVDQIIDAVATRGDAALIELTKKFDAVSLTPETLAVTPQEVEEAYGKIDADTLGALELAHARIKDHHARQRPDDQRYTDDAGAELGYRWTAVEAAGLYVPGGRASYPSSVLMNAVPAKVAGVPRVVMVVPTPGGELNPLVLAAAKIAGVDEIYRIGGAQAVAALALGTEMIAPVAKIVGPGNAYVAAAKRRVFGTVGIDSIAGPSEVLIIADGDNNPEWVAADLLAQAEHDANAQSVLMTDSEVLAEAVEAAVIRQLQDMPRGEIAAASWRDFGAIIVLRDLDEAPALADRFAAEHLEIATADCEGLAAKIRNAGAIFLGHYTPEAVGDYVAGPNHVLPTARSARFSSGLGVLDFMKRTSILKLNRSALDTLGPAAMALATSEGLDGHRQSIAVRLEAAADVVETTPTQPAVMRKATG